MKKLSFRDFLELNEPKKLGYLDALGDEMGVDPTSLQKTPFAAANFSLDKTYNLSSFTILDYIKDSSGNIVAAQIKLNQDPNNRTLRAYSKVNGSYVRDKSMASNDKVYTVPIDKLNQMLSQGLNQSAQMPPGGGL